MENEDPYTVPGTDQTGWVHYSLFVYEFGFAQRIGASNGFLTLAPKGQSLVLFTQLPPPNPGTTQALGFAAGYTFRL